jgi:hypothetical protein
MSACLQEISSFRKALKTDEVDIHAYNFRFFIIGWEKF